MSQPPVLGSDQALHGICQLPVPLFQCRALYNPKAEYEGEADPSVPHFTQIPLVRITRMVLQLQGFITDDQHGQGCVVSTCQRSARITGLKAHFQYLEAREKNFQESHRGMRSGAHQNGLPTQLFQRHLAEQQNTVCRAVTTDGEIRDQQIAVGMARILDRRHRAQIELSRSDQMVESWRVPDTMRNRCETIPASMGK